MTVWYGLIFGNRSGCGRNGVVLAMCGVVERPFGTFIFMLV